MKYSLKMPSIALALLGLCAAASAQMNTLPGTMPTWNPEVLDLAASLPIQDGGRIKPLDTFAQFSLLQMNGKRTYTPEDGEPIKSIEWLLDCLFYPEQAKDFKNFIVNFDEVISAAGLDAHDKKRDRYSYNELLPGRAKLMSLAGQYSQKDAKDRSLVEVQILGLAHNMMQFEGIIQGLDLARQRFHIHEGSALAAAFPEGSEITASTALKRLPEIIATLRTQINEAGQEKLEPEIQAVTEMMQQLQHAALNGDALAMVAPSDPNAKEWLSPASVASVLTGDETADPNMLAALEDLEKMAALNGPGEFLSSLKSLHGKLKADAEARGEYSKIPIEVSYYRGKYLFYSQWLYVLSFVLVAFTWLLPRNKPLAIGAFSLITVATVLLTVGITYRCIIRGRPPVSTLYETILFITAVSVAVALVAEAINRRRAALAIGSFLGMFGMFLAFRYEAKEGVDTMPELVAVLDTNYWLATHVTSVTMGYAAGLLAGALAHIYIFGKLFKFKREDKAFYKTVSRMVYGVLCFGLLFAIVGTILGGIWANESWGRFWGWDPKENGALMICLWGLIVLHARMGGYIRDMGVAICSVAMGMIVAFSWWGVNLLGVGMHSYGFTNGIWNMLRIFWGIESVVIALGVYAAMRDRAPVEAKEKHASASGKHQTV